MRIPLFSALFSLAALSSGCPTKPTGDLPHRLELRKVSANLVELVPRPGAPPNCLAFSVAENGVIRQLTMNADNRSVHCEPGQPIGGVPFRIPANEGKTKIYVFFSDQSLK